VKPAPTLRLIPGGAQSGPDKAASDASDAPVQDTDTLPQRVSRERPLGPGDIIDRYCIDRMIAAGGMARVYRAVHEFTGRVVALKVMRTRYADRPDLIERFQMEAQALTRIRHPNVVTIENGGLTDKGEVFIAMELLDGRTLREVLTSRTRLPIEETLDIVCQVARGVAAAHDANVIHRDLKPENIFCTRDGATKVLDLGLAKFVDVGAKETDASTAPIGTAAYMSPERLDGMPVDARSDVYSLGLIAYECLAGHHPLVPEADWPSRDEVALRQLTYHPPALRQLPGDVSHIIAQAMSKSPSRRYATMRDFLATLHHARAALDAIPISPTPSPTPTPTRAHAPTPAPTPTPTPGRPSVSPPEPVSRTEPFVGPPPGIARPATAEPEERERRIARRAILTGAIVGLVFGVALYFGQRHLFGAPHAAEHAQSAVAPQIAPTLRSAMERPPVPLAPVAQAPAAQTPAAQTPAAQTPAAQTPAAQTPAAQTPATQTPTAQTPTAQTPVAHAPAVETPVAQAPKTRELAALPSSWASPPVASSPSPRATASAAPPRPKPQRRPAPTTPKTLPDLPASGL
jgi:serine/threonine-protein kinase